ncbi:MAG: hypothetical protein C7B47_16475, partial [Sulfobacillus thermosulfidooxidans]
MTTGKPATSHFFIRRIMLWFLALGPGVLGMVADNDAGGMLSYLVTGSHNHLPWFVLALFIMAPITFLIQDLALQVALATHLPYSQIIAHKFGSGTAKFNAIILHFLNMMILITEFIGMTSALDFWGVPWNRGLIASFLVVLAVTLFRHVRQMEHLLLMLAVANLAFIPALFLLHPSIHTWHKALSGGFNHHIPFLLLSLAGNAITPWMIFWQQNAVWAGNVKNLSSGEKDIRTGILAQVFMATVVILIGALAAPVAVSGRNPLLWLQHYGSTTVAGLFAVGLFDAGFLAASTISVSSAWMVQEAFSQKLLAPNTSPTQGRFSILHIATLSVTAAVVLSPHLPTASLALWSQALGALWMPITLAMLGLIARDPQIMGQMAMPRRRQFLLGS